MGESRGSSGPVRDPKIWATYWPWLVTEYGSAKMMDGSGVVVCRGQSEQVAARAGSVLLAGGSESALTASAEMKYLRVGDTAIVMGKQRGEQRHEAAMG